MDKDKKGKTRGRNLFFHFVVAFCFAQQITRRPGVGKLIYPSMARDRDGRSQGARLFSFSPHAPALVPPRPLSTLHVYYMRISTSPVDGWDVSKVVCSEASRIDGAVVSRLYAFQTKNMMKITIIIKRGKARKERRKTCVLRLHGGRPGHLREWQDIITCAPCARA